MGLELIRPPQPPSYDLAAISPLLSGALIRHRVRPEDGTHQIDFDTDFDGPILAASLALKTVVEPYTEDSNFSQARLHRGVKAGLRTLTYPNSRIMRSAKYVERGSRRNLLGAREDIRGLLAAITYPEHHRMVHARLTLYGELMAEFAVEQSLSELSPKHLQTLCNDYNVPFNELAHRRSEANITGSQIDPRQFVGDIESLKLQFRHNKFKRVSLLPDEDESRLADKDNWPKSGWSEKASAVQCVRLLPPTDVDCLGERWQVLIRDDTSARHVVRPQLQIRSDTERYNQQLYQSPNMANIWKGPPSYLVFDPQPPQYDRASHTYIHSSAILGAALLLRHVDTRVINDALHRSLWGKNYRPWIDNRLPDKAAGLAPLVLHSLAVQRQILAGSSLRGLAAHVNESSFATLLPNS